MPVAEEVTVPRGWQATVDAGLRWSPAQALLRTTGPGGLAVLAYHGVDDPERFDRHAAFLRRHYRPVELAEVVAARRRGRPLPARAVLITFDDGERSLLEHGVPVLRAHGLPAVAFVVAGLLDTDEPFWWVEAAELAAAGGRTGVAGDVDPPTLVGRLKTVPDTLRRLAIDELRATADLPAGRIPQLRRDELPGLESTGVAVGNHSLTHPCLPRCEPDAVLREVTEAHDILTAALGHPPVAFAYPNGDVSPLVASVVASAGHELAFGFDHRRSGWPPPDRLRVSRLRVNSTTSLDRLAIIASGLHPRVHAALGRR